MVLKQKLDRTITVPGQNTGEKEGQLFSTMFTESRIKTCKDNSNVCNCRFHHVTSLSR